MKRFWLLVVISLVLWIILGIIGMVEPAYAHRQHHHRGHFSIWVGPPIIWTPPPVYRPYYSPPYYYYYPPQDYYYPRYREWIPGYWEWDFYYNRQIWIPGYWRIY